MNYSKLNQADDAEFEDNVIEMSDRELDSAGDDDFDTTAASTQLRRQPERILCLPKVVWAHLALVLIQLIYTFFYVFAKIALRSVTPFIFAGFRIAFGVLSLAPLVWRFDRFVPKTKRQVALLFLFGIFGVSVNQILTILGVDKAGAIVVGILQPATPILTAVMSIALKNEKFHWLKLLGLLLGMAGLLVMVRFWAFEIKSEASIGAIMIICAAVSIAFGTNLQLWAVKSGIPVMSVTFYSFLFGMIWISIVFIYDATTYDFSRLELAAIGAMAYCGVVAMTLTYSLNLWALKQTTPTIVNCYVFLQPVFSAISGTLLLGEQLLWTHVGGGALAIVGLSAVIAGRFLESRREL